jgi:hypothetical protein
MITKKELEDHLVKLLYWNTVPFDRQEPNRQYSQSCGSTFLKIDVTGVVEGLMPLIQAMKDQEHLDHLDKCAEQADRGEGMSLSGMSREEIKATLFGGSI